MYFWCGNKVIEVTVQESFHCLIDIVLQELEISSRHVVSSERLLTGTPTMFCRSRCLLTLLRAWFFTSIIWRAFLQWISYKLVVDHIDWLFDAWKFTRQFTVRVPDFTVANFCAFLVIEIAQYILDACIGEKTQTLRASAFSFR